MTRTYTAEPIWTWKCSRCGGESADALARQQGGLPSADEMRRRGWRIPDRSDLDLCPVCVKDIG